MPQCNSLLTPASKRFDLKPALYLIRACDLSHFTLKHHEEIFHPLPTILNKSP